MNEPKITTLLLDIGGVLLTNAWGRSSRALAAKEFSLDLDELNERHHLCFDTYEMGKLSMHDYLKQIVFYKKREFSEDTFKSFIFNQSQAIPESLEYFKQLKVRHNLKLYAVNNEAKEMNEFRIKEFALTELFDGFISSCYVGLRKPDIDIFHFACNIAHARPPHVLFIDDRAMFVEVATGLGIQAIQFDDLSAVKAKVSKLNFAYNND